MQTGIRKIENSAEIRLRDSIVLANNAVFECAQKELSDMGCVLTALLIENETATIGHVGDTRLYKIHRGEFNKLTTDHSFVGQLEEEGELSEKRLLEHPRRHEVTRCVGFEEKSFEDEGFADIYQTGFEPDAAFLLCSDGLSDLLTAAQIHEIIAENAAMPQKIVKHLIGKANELGGKDNITVIFVGGRDFAETADRADARPKVSKKYKIFGLILNRWAFLIYGLLLGGSVVLLLLQRLFEAPLEVPAP